MYSILIIDDNMPLARSLCSFLEKNGYDCNYLTNGKQAEIAIQKFNPDLVLLDMMLPDTDGISLMKVLTEKCPDTRFIIITAHGSIQSALSATRLGAVDYLVKPFEPEQLLIVIKNEIENQRLSTEVRTLRNQTIFSERKEIDLSHCPYPSVKFRESYELAVRVANLDHVVLLLGETGCGKDHMARQIYLGSSRKDKPFFIANCAALSRELAESELFGHEKGAFTGANVRKRGWLELSDTGTLVMDEVGELDLAIQAKLLTFFDQKNFLRVGGETPVTVNTRIIATTNRDLQSEIQKGNFRQDLYFRLNMFPIKLPALRERREDIPILVREILYSTARTMQLHKLPVLEDKALQMLCEYSYPGNIRELRNIIERALILSKGESIGFPELKLQFSDDEKFNPKLFQDISGFSLDEKLRQVEKTLIENALKESSTLEKAAKTLGLSRHALSYRMKKLDVAFGNIRDPRF